MNGDPLLIVSLVGMLLAYLLGRVTRALESPMGGTKQNWVVTMDNCIEVRLADGDGVYRCKVYLDADESMLIARAVTRDKR